VNATLKRPFLALTAADLMSADVVMVPRAMCLQTAAHLLSESHVSGAPVVNEAGQCIGVLSTTDFMHWVGHGERCAARPDCSPSRSFHSAWQVVDVDALPMDAVGSYMTANPVMVPPNTPIDELARMMTDAHIHRLIVVDATSRPLGIVSSTDVVAAVANADRHDR
jgi:CBS-domain-containing membrane protein